MLTLVAELAARRRGRLSSAHLFLLLQIHGVAVAVVVRRRRAETVRLAVDVTAAAAVAAVLL